jgi:hypothetical protein
MPPLWNDTLSRCRRARLENAAIDGDDKPARKIILSGFFQNDVRPNCQPR